MPGSFLCLCPSKTVETVEDNFLHRQDKIDQIQEALKEVTFAGKDKIVLCLPGGGIAAEGLGTNPEVAIVGSFLAVLSGTISNYAYLVRKYFVEELGYARNVSLEAIRQSSPIRDSALLCKLYERLGTGMLPKLRGDFSFCLYDSSTVRVLAARDPSGTIPLYQGQTSDGSLFISSGEYKPEDAQDVVEILPGRFKYGWRALPRKYANPQELVDTSKKTSSNAALEALKGIPMPKRRKGQRKAVAAVPAVPQGPKLRTKQEIRAWSALIAQDAIEAYEKGYTVSESPQFGDAMRTPPSASKRRVQGRRETSPDEMERYIRNSKFKPQVLAALFGPTSTSSQDGSAPRSSVAGDNTNHSASSQCVSESVMTTSESSGSLHDSNDGMQKFGATQTSEERKVDDVNEKLGGITLGTRVEAST
ncbi:hypothetical protein BSKO_11178 [Bryopsis sp. KO-2023]|nr:hypothetical protein BSKO_11178 [Bryopsis sp. KO-2023]